VAGLYPKGGVGLSVAEAQNIPRSLEPDDVLLAHVNASLNEHELLPQPVGLRERLLQLRLQVSGSGCLPMRLYLPKISSAARFVRLLQLRLRRLLLLLLLLLLRRRLGTTMDHAEVCNIMVVYTAQVCHITN
jgi:hypothetical protein